MCVCMSKGVVMNRSLIVGCGTGLGCFNALTFLSYEPRRELKHILCTSAFGCILGTAMHAIVSVPSCRIPAVVGLTGGSVLRIVAGNN